MNPIAFSILILISYRKAEVVCVCVCVCVLVAQLCPTLCNCIDCSPLVSSDHGILQARISEQFAILFSRDLPDPGIEPRSPSLQAGSLLPEPPGKPKVTHGGGLAAGSGPTLCNPMDCSHQPPPTMENSSMDFPGKNTAVGCHFLLHSYYEVIIIAFKSIMILAIAVSLPSKILYIYIYIYIYTLIIIYFYGVLSKHPALYPAP